MAEQAKALRGVCFFFSETGTEGGYWAFQDSAYIKSPEEWSYDGLHVLKNGDRLTIFSPDDSGRVVWSGVIALQLFPLFSESASGLWIHANQQGADRAKWAEYFFKQYPAELNPA